MSEYTFSQYKDWSTTSKSTGYFIKNSNPVDDRYVVDTYDNIATKIGNRAYPGLHIYVIDTGKEYWFVGGDNNGNSLQLVEYKPWMSDINTLITNKPWMSDIGGGSGESGGSSSTTSATVLTLDANTCSKDNIPAYLAQNVTGSQSGDEVNVIYTESGEESFTKYVYLNDAWRIAYGSQTISFTLSAYQSGSWDSWTPPTDSSVVKYVKGSEGVVTVYIKHSFCTQYVDSTLYADDSTLDLDNDGTTDPYGEELLANIKCVKLSSAEQSGFWVRIDLHISSSASVPAPTSTYTLLLQR